MSAVNSVPMHKLTSGVEKCESQKEIAAIDAAGSENNDEINILIEKTGKNNNNNNSDNYSFNNTFPPPHQQSQLRMWFTLVPSCFVLLFLNGSLNISLEMFYELSKPSNIVGYIKVILYLWCMYHCHINTAVLMHAGSGSVLRAAFGKNKHHDSDKNIDSVTDSISVVDGAEIGTQGDRGLHRILEGGVTQKQKHYLKISFLIILTWIGGNLVDDLDGSIARITETRSSFGEKMDHRFFFFFCLKCEYRNRSET